MIDVKQELRVGGVAGLYRKCEIGGPAVAEAGQYGSDLRRAWAENPYSGVMMEVALQAGVGREMLAWAAFSCVDRFVAEAGVEPHALVKKALQVSRAALEDRAAAKVETLNDSSRACAEWIHTAKDRGVVCEQWDLLLVICCGALTQAVGALVCKCPAPHALEFRNSLQGCLRYIVHAWIEQATAVGRVPAGTPSSAVVEWAAQQVANVIREQIPVELVLAPRLQIPTVTLERGVVPPRRERGQA
jgi:hypothetical protein